MTNSLSKENIETNLTVHAAGKILVGPEVNYLPKKQLIKYSGQVSDYLSKHPHTMLQYPGSAIMGAIREAKALLCLDPDSQALLAFCQIKYYGQHESKQPLYELQSLAALVGQNGYGRQVLEAGINYAADVYPYIRLLGIVASTNLKAQQLMSDFGSKVGYKYSETIQDPGGKHAFMHIYDITRKSKTEPRTVKVGFGGVWEWEQPQLRKESYEKTLG